LPADGRDMERQRERLTEQHSDEWRRRTAALASTWNVATAVAKANAALHAALDEAYPAPTD